MPEIARSTLESAGYLVTAGGLESAHIAELRELVSPVLAAHADRGGVRDVLTKLPALESTVVGPMKQLAIRHLGPSAFAVRILLFDKTPLANWKATWHQDVTIAVTEYRDVSGWGPWSRKDGGWHVRPPAGVLASMLTVRLHLDECGADNGPVRVIPGSHRAGRLNDGEIESATRATPPVDCLVPVGDALLLKPLILHSSAPASAPAHRRVLHAEFAASALPDGFEWATRVA